MSFQNAINVKLIIVFIFNFISFRPYRKNQNLKFCYRVFSKICVFMTSLMLKEDKTDSLKEHLKKKKTYFTTDCQWTVKMIKLNSTKQGR